MERFVAVSYFMHNSRLAFCGPAKPSVDPWTRGRI